MNNGSIYQRKDKRWCAQYRDADDRSRYLYRKTKALAKEVLRDALKDRDDGISPSKLTVNDVLAHWLEESKHEILGRTWSNRESLIRVHFEKHPIGSTKLSELNHDRVSFYLKSKRDLAPSTRKKLLSILKHAATEGVRRRVLRFNPVDGLRVPREDLDEINLLPPRQIRHLLQTVRGHRYELVVVLGATMGLRVGEALGMKWEDVDFDRGILEVKRTIYRGNPYGPKTKTSRRRLKIPTRALEALTRRSKPTGYLCPTVSGNPTDPANFHPQWKRILETAELPIETTFHALRHGAASLLLNQNVPIPVVSRYLGHANPAITMQIYAHVIDGMGDVAASGMDEALG